MYNSVIGSLRVLTVPVIKGRLSATNEPDATSLGIIPIKPAENRKFPRIRILHHFRAFIGWKAQIAKYFITRVNYLMCNFKRYTTSLDVLKFLQARYDCGEEHSEAEKNKCHENLAT